MKGTKRPQVHHTHNQIKNKNIEIDQDYFHHFRNMKHTKRNIFETMGEDARVRIFEEEGHIRIEQHNHNQRSRIYDNNQNMPDAHSGLNNRPAGHTNKGLGDNEEAQEQRPVEAAQKEVVGKLAEKSLVATKAVEGEPVHDLVATTREDWTATEAKCLDGGCGDPILIML